MKYPLSYLTCLAMAALLPTGSVSGAEPAEGGLVVCDFNSADQSSLAEIPVMSAGGELRWSDSFTDSSTDGEGAYYIRRPADGPYNAYLTLDGLRIEDTEVYLEAVITGYRFADEAEERINFGLTRNDRQSPKIVAQIVLDRADDDTVDLSLSALGDGATKPMVVAELPAVLNEPLTVVLKYDPARVMYEGSYRIGNGDWHWLGEGKTDRSRYAWYLRFRASGSFAGADEYVAVDRISLTREDPRSPAP